MDLALYDPELGYYARAAQRSGRAGDFFTSVDVGPLFGELLEIQLAEMARILQTADARASDVRDLRSGRGRRRQRPAVGRHPARGEARAIPSSTTRIRLHLVEASAEARARAARRRSATCADRLVVVRRRLPDSFEGVLIANELLDALPVHQVVMRDDGLREVYVDVADSSRRRRRRPAPPTDDRRRSAVDARARRVSRPARRRRSNPAGASRSTCARSTGSATPRGACARGFIILIDYGHEARELYSASHAPAR